MSALPAIYVEWLDACHLKNQWHEVADLGADLLVCSTLGWLVKETDTAILVALTMADEGDQVVGVLNIPTSAITKRVLLKEPDAEVQEAGQTPEPEGTQSR